MAWRDSTEGKGVALSCSGLAEMRPILLPYFWPRNPCIRTYAFSSFAVLAVSKACNIIGPLFLRQAVDQLTHAYETMNADDEVVASEEFSVPWDMLIIYAACMLGTSLFDELQRFLYLDVKVDAFQYLAETTFRHIHSLSVQWHLTEKTGKVLRTLDRGLRSADTVVSMVFMRLAPLFFELAAYVLVLFLGFKAFSAGIALGIGFTFYCVATWYINEWRRGIRASMNKHDNTANAIAVDSITHAATVKLMTAESFEARRYSKAALRFAKASFKTGQSLAVINVTQKFITTLTMLAVLVAGAYDVVNGKSTIGDFILLQSYAAQIFVPLSFLGTIYSMLATAWVDLSNLLSILQARPNVTDKPGAKPLRLPVAVMRPWLYFDNAVSAIPVGSRFSNKEDEVEAEKAAHVAARKLALADQEAEKAAPAGAAAPAWGAPLTGVRIEFKDVCFSYDSRDAGDELEQAEMEELAQETAAKSKAAKLSTGQAAAATSAAAAGARRRKGGDGATAAAADDEAAVDLEDVAPSVSRRVVDKVSFTIEPGTTTAIVGSTGSGKSTISRLLFRFYDVASGSISVNGQDIRDVQQRSLRRVIGVCPQDTVLFNSTVRFNLKYGRPDATDEEMIEAARGASIHEYIQDLPHGYETVVGDRGLKLSGGERQRVAIARALLKDPPIMVMDEATSALDNMTEKRVQSALDAAATGRTVLVIAHRLSTIKNAEQILVMERGAIVERGSHQELLDAHGKYFELWSGQQAHDGVVEKSPLVRDDDDASTGDAAAAPTAATPSAAAPAAAPPAEESKEG